MSSHEAFIQKHELTVPLASDPTGAACEAFGVWVEKSLYGRKFMGIVRTTFLIDGGGGIVKIWRRVKTPGHAEKVLDAVREMHAGGAAR